MATTTVAAGRIRNKANEGLPTPDGWVLDNEGLPSTDPLVAREKGGFLTSLGGSPENSSYKGYGLAAMVNILASCLSGATLITDPMHTKKPQGMDIGHFFMAIDPGLFREADEFQTDVARFCGDLRATTPVDPAQPVMVAGDPQWKNAEKRMAEGIPVGPGPAQPGAADRPGLRRAVAAGLGIPSDEAACVTDWLSAFGTGSVMTWLQRSFLNRRDIGVGLVPLARGLLWRRGRDRASCSIVSGSMPWPRVASRTASSHSRRWRKVLVTSAQIDRCAFPRSMRRRPFLERRRTRPPVRPHRRWDVE